MIARQWFEVLLLIAVLGLGQTYDFPLVASKGSNQSRLDPLPPMKENLNLVATKILTPMMENILSDKATDQRAPDLDDSHTEFKDIDSDFDIEASESRLTSDPLKKEPLTSGVRKEAVVGNSLAKAKDAKNPKDVKAPAVVPTRKDSKATTTSTTAAPSKKGKDEAPILLPVDKLRARTQARSGAVDVKKQGRSHGFALISTILFFAIGYILH